MGRGLNMEHFTLRIEHIEHFPNVLSTFLGIYQTRLNILSISPVLGIFRNSILYFQVFWHLWAPKKLNILSISPVLGTFRNSILYFQVFWHLWAPKNWTYNEHFPCFRHFLKFHPLFSGVLAPVSPKNWTYWTFPLFYAFLGLGLCFKGFGASITKSYLKVWLREGGVGGGLGEVGGGLEFSHAITAATTQKRRREKEIERERESDRERERGHTHTHIQNKEG